MNGNETWRKAKDSSWAILTDRAGLKKIYGIGFGLVWHTALLNKCCSVTFSILVLSLLSFVCSGRSTAPFPREVQQCREKGSICPSLRLQREWVCGCGTGIPAKSSSDKGSWETGFFWELVTRPTHRVHIHLWMETMEEQLLALHLGWLWALIFHNKARDRVSKMFLWVLWGMLQVH